MNNADQTQQQQPKQEQAQESSKASGGGFGWVGFGNEVPHFIGRAQLGVIQAGLRGEEWEYFTDKLKELAERFTTMPKTYEQDGAADPIAHLHYFRGTMDFYITERDLTAEQLQAFGWADLGHGGELGYINIKELIDHGVELDLHFDPKPLSECKRR